MCPPKSDFMTSLRPRAASTSLSACLRPYRLAFAPIGLPSPLSACLRRANLVSYCRLMAFCDNKDLGYDWFR
jgi:hypothetical protein